MSRFQRSLVWFRRDLRSFDHAALHAALAQSEAVYCLFVFDRAILDPLPRDDRRVAFIHASVLELERELRAMGGGLIVRHGDAVDSVLEVAAEYRIEAVFAGRDYEPAAVGRDQAAAQRLAAASCAFFSLKDQVIFDGDEVLTQAGKPFSVFTPYKNAWLKTLRAAAGPDGEPLALQACPIEPHAASLAPPKAHARLPGLGELGFTPPGQPLPAGMSGAKALLDDFLPRLADYGRARDFPALPGTSRLSVHLRFGTVSVRGLARRALDAMRSGEGGDGAEVWLSELIWRDFYFMILDRNPHVVGQAFKPAYDALAWEGGEAGERLFQAWCEGRTGYPLVDAAMLQLNQTGFMHNRLRMVTASFLTKDLGVDWRRGERYFALKLNDYDLAANNGGWQWAASTGCDAQPYFRIFNPVSQSEKYDPQGTFIKRFLPQLAGLSARQIHAPWRLSPSTLQDCGIVLGRDYPLPVVDHEDARQQTLARFAAARGAGNPA